MRLVHNDVAVAVHDWPGMRARVTEIVHNYRLNPPPLPEDEVKEAIAFLDWIARDNFTFLGMREYRLPSGDTAADPSRARASASCAIRPCACCGAAASSWR